MLSYGAPTSTFRVPHIVTFHYNNPHHPTTTHALSDSVVTRRALSLLAMASVFSVPISVCNSSAAAAPTPRFAELPESGGVKALDLRVGGGDSPVNGDQVAIHYYGRLAAKQGWRFDSTYDHKDETGEPIPFTFVLGSGKVIAGIQSAVRSMKVGGICRSSSRHLKDIKTWIKSPFHQTILTGKGCLLPFSTLHALQMEKARPWGLSYLTSNWSA